MTFRYSENFQSGYLNLVGRSLILEQLEQAKAELCNRLELGRSFGPKSTIAYLRTGQGKIALIGVVVAIAIPFILLGIQSKNKRESEKEVYEKVYLDLVSKDMIYVAEKAKVEVFSRLLSTLDDYRMKNYNYLSIAIRDFERFLLDERKSIQKQIDSQYYIATYANHYHSWNEENIKNVTFNLNAKLLKRIEQIYDNSINIRRNTTLGDRQQIDYLLKAYKEETMVE